MAEWRAREEIMIHRIAYEIMKLLVGAALGAALFCADFAQAQTYPTRPVTVVVPFTAGGPTDALMRILGEHMRTTLGQNLLVENVTGAAGTIGVGRVARASPDGYTLSVGHWSTHVINGAVYPLNFDLLKDLAPIARLTHYPMLLVSKNAVPASDLKALLAYLKQNQDKVSAGSIGVGSAAHVAGVYFEKLTGLKLQYVPYRGAAPALQDMMAGQIDILFDHVSNSLPHVQAGKIRAYAVTDKVRLPSAPNIPTFDEAGIAGLHVSIWYGMWAPKGTPQDIIARLSGAVRDALADPAVRKRLAELGQVIPPVEEQTSEALAAHQKAEIDKWWPIVRAANIKVQ
jgi:tripartite-type tricarboxylate transporter receptor subunit TctC